MKKTAYITPEIEVEEFEVTQMICASIIGIDGDTDITLGIGEAPDIMDSRFFDFGEDGVFFKEGTSIE